MSQKDLVVKNHLKGKNKVVGIRVSIKTIDKLNAKGIDIHSTVRNLLDSLAE